MWSSFPLPPPHHVVDPYRAGNMAQGFAGPVPYQMMPVNQRPWRQRSFQDHDPEQHRHEESPDPALYEDFSAQASASLDADLEHHSHWVTPGPALQSLPSQARHRDPHAFTEAGLSYSSHPAGEYEGTSEFYSLDGSPLHTSQLNNSSGTYSMVPERDSPTRANAGSSSTPGTMSSFLTAGDNSRDELFHRSDLVKSNQEESPHYHSVLEDDKSILAWESRSGPQARVARGCPTGAGDDTKHHDSAPGHAGAKPRTVERAVSPWPRIVTCDASVGTETRCVSADAQTEAPATADQSTSTRIHMADLDYLAQVQFYAEELENSQCVPSTHSC
ncbi:unnamed protein product [Merluccius merluccius]